MCLGSCPQGLATSSRVIMSKAMIKMFDPVLTWAARKYQAAVATELKKYGLRYEDLYDPQLNMDIDEAIHRLPQDVVDARMQRLKRAVDCSLKKSYLSKEIQDMQTPYSWYLKETWAEVQAENTEKAMLGTGKDYDRSFP
ncbi:hypothetical protein WJX77_004418 [Trebouxia sp. C0004]